MKKNFILLLFPAFLLLSAALTGCHEPAQGRNDYQDPLDTMEEIRNDSSLKEISANIPTGKAKDIRAEIWFPVGELNVSPGSDYAVQGTYRFYLKKWVPVVSFEEDNQEGHLRILTSDRNTAQSYGDLDQSDWDIKLNNRISTDLTIRCVAGEGHIDLNGCNLSRFDFTMTAGEMEIDLSNTSVPGLSFKALAGDAVIDLTGRWENDLHATIQGGVGEMTLKLPANEGISLEVHGLLGDVDAPGLSKEGRFYSNALYGKNSENLYIDFTGAIGSLEVILVD